MSKKFIGGIPLPTALEIKAPMNPNTNRIWTEITDLTDSVNGIPDSLLFGGIEIVIEGLRGVYKWNGGDRTLLSSWVNELQEVETRTATLESTTSGLSAGEIYSIPRATYTPSTEPTPTKNGNYRAEAGTYTNWGGTVVPATDGFIYSINVSDVDTTPVYKVDGVDLNIEKATKIASGNTDVATSDAVFNFGLQTAENKNIIPNANFEGIRVSTSPDKTANYYYDVSASKDTNGVTLVEENIPKGFADRALKINLLAGQRISYFSGTNGVNIVLEDGDKYSIGVWLYNEDWSAFDSNTGDIIVHKRFGDSSSQGFSDYYSVGNWRFYYSNNNTYDVTKLGVYVYVTFLNQTNTNNEIFYTAYASIIKGESIFPKFYTNYPKTVELIKDNIDITALNDSLKAKFSADNSVAEELTTLSIANFTLNATSGWDYNTYSKTNFGSHYEIKGQVDFSGSGYNQTRFMINLNGAWSGGNPSASTYESNIEFQKRYYGNTFEVVLNDENTTVGGKEQGRVAISPKVKDIIDFKIEVHQQNVIVFVDGIQVLNGTLTADLTGDFIVYVDSGHGICDISNLKVSATRNFLQKDILQVANISNKFTEIDIDLTSLEDIKKVGGVVTVGTQGTNNSVVKLPIVANENCTIDFDFEFGKDVHSGFGRERILEMAFNSDDFNAIEGGNIGALKLLLDINSVLPVSGNFVPNFRSRFEYGFAHGNYNWTDYTNKYQYNSELFNNSLNREDAFSIRKVTPVAADVNITLTIDSTKLSIKDNGVVVSEYTLANYTLVDDLLDAIEADSNLSDYEVLRFQSAIPTSDLTKMTDVKLVVLRNAVDYNDGETVTGTIYDGFEVFAPINSVGKKHNCKILIDYDNDDYKILIDGVELGLTDSNFPANLKRLNGWLTLGGSSLYSDTTGTFTGKITSFKLRKGLIKPKKFVVMTGHIVQDAKDYPSGSGDYGHLITSTGRLNRIFDYANQNGYKPVSIYDIVNYKKGWVDESQIPDKCYTIIFDDYPFWIHQTERFRNVFKRYGVKANMALQMDFIQSSENLKTIKQMKSLGWEIFPHSYKHAYIDRYSYPQLIQTLTEIRTVFDTLEIDTNVFVYPYGSIDKKTAKVLKSRGFQLGFKVGSSDINYGEDDFQMNRLDTSEIGTSWSGITNVLDR